MTLLKSFFLVFLVLLFSSRSHSGENKAAFDIDNLTNIKKIQIFIYPFNGSYSIYGGLSAQLEHLRKSAGLKIEINSIVQIMEYEKQLKLTTFVPIKNYDQFIEEFETYVMFIIGDLSITTVTSKK